MNRREMTDTELSIVDLLDMILENKYIVALVTLLFLILAAIMYISVPPRYKAEVDITAVSGGGYANYSNLVSTQTLEYSRDELLAEFAKYLADSDTLLAAEAESKVEKVNVDVETSLPGQVGVTGGPFFIRFIAQYGDKEALDSFVATALRKATIDFAEGLRFEITQKLASQEEINASAIERLRLDIEARREKVKADRLDEIERLSSAALVARSFGLDKPLELQAQSLTVDGANPGNGDVGGEEYFNGYLALEEKVNLLKSRQSDDAFIADLRALEQDIFLRKNDPQVARIKRLLNESMLSKPEEAKLVTYSLASSEAKKVFPNLIIFAGAALVLGAFSGLSLALYFGAKRTRKRADA